MKAASGTKRKLPAEQVARNLPRKVLAVDADQADGEGREGQAADGHEQPQAGGRGKGGKGRGRGKGGRPAQAAADGESEMKKKLMDKLMANTV